MERSAQPEEGEQQQLAGNEASRVAVKLDRPRALVGAAPVFRREFLHPRNWHKWLLLGLLVFVGLLPRRVHDALADGIGYLNYRFNQKRAGYAAVNLAWCFPELSEAERERLARRHFQAQAGAMLDIPVFRFASVSKLDRLIGLQGMQHIDDAQRQGRSVIVLCCHSSAIDAGGVALSTRVRSVTVFNPFKNAFADWLIFGSRTRFDMQLARRDDGLRPLIKSIRDGAVLVHISDEDLGASRSVFAEFFGCQKATVPVLGRLAKTCNAAVIPCYPWYDRRERRYQFVLLPALHVDWGEDIVEDARAMNRAIQRMIEICPEQYIWTMRMFKTRPNGEPSPYIRR